MAKLGSRSLLAIFIKLQTARGDGDYGQKLRINHFKSAYQQLLEIVLLQVEDLILRNSLNAYTSVFIEFQVNFLKMEVMQTI